MGVTEENKVVIKDIFVSEVIVLEAGGAANFCLKVLLMMLTFTKVLMLEAFVLEAEDTERRRCCR